MRWRGGQTPQLSPSQACAVCACLACGLCMRARCGEQTDGGLIVQAGACVRVGETPGANPDRGISRRGARSRLGGWACSARRPQAALLARWEVCGLNSRETGSHGQSRGLDPTASSVRGPSKSPPRQATLIGTGNKFRVPQPAAPVWPGHTPPPRPLGQRPPPFHTPPPCFALLFEDTVFFLGITFNLPHGILSPGTAYPCPPTPSPHSPPEI